jgi:hypothetical protein
MMIRHRRLTTLLAIAIFSFDATAYAEDSQTKATAPGIDVDSEHIFGFAEGSDIGSKGEREIESISVGSFGALGSYNNVDNETSVRYGAADHLRLSIGTLSDYYNIHNVPGLADRSSINFSGLITEIRWNILDRATNAFGMTLSFNPQWRYRDQFSGERSQNYSLPLTLLVDKELIPSKFFMAFNFVYGPTSERLNSAWTHQDSLTFIGAATYSFVPNTFLGVEVRHENFALNGSIIAHALYAGPSFYYSFSKDLSAKVAWAQQIPDIGATTLDLVNYQREQVQLEIAYTF